MTLFEIKVQDEYASKTTWNLLNNENITTLKRKRKSLSEYFLNFQLSFHLYFDFLILGAKLKTYAKVLWLEESLSLKFGMIFFDKSAVR